MAKRKPTPLVRKYKSGKIVFNVQAYDVLTLQKLVEQFIYTNRNHRPTQLIKTITLHACLSVLVEFLGFNKWSVVYGNNKTFAVKPYQAAALVIALDRSDEPFFIELKAALLKSL
jgi:hypothetical protein